MKLLLLIPIVSFLSFCRGYKTIPGRSNYLQYLRAQNFIQEKPRYNKLNQNYSEDLNEFDHYEDEELDDVRAKTPRKSRKDKQIEKTDEASIGQGSDNGKNYENNANKLEFKDIENELHSNELLKDDSDINLIKGGNECTISEQGILDVSLDSNDIFNLNKYNVEISSSNILIKDINNSNVIKTIPFESIKLPIETIEETRECWNIKLKKEKILFCEKKKQDRDVWITNILKALFCYNTNNLIIEKKYISNEKIYLPKHSTVDERIKALKNLDKNGNDTNPTYVKSSKSNNISISNLKDNEPKIVFGDA